MFIALSVITFDHLTEKDHADEAAQLAADAEEPVEKLVEKHKRGEVEGNEDEDYEEEEEDDYEEEEDSGDDYAGGDDDEEEDLVEEEEDEDDYDDKPKKGNIQFLNMPYYIK